VDRSLSFDVRANLARKTAKRHGRKTNPLFPVVAEDQRRDDGIPEGHAGIHHQDHAAADEVAALASAKK